MTNLAQIGFGTVRHARLQPVHHAFAYAGFFLLLPMRGLSQANTAVAINRPGLISFHDVDHGDGRSTDACGALAWLDELLRAQGLGDCDGEVWLHCYPRVLGYTFKPVSFWYCHRKGGELRAIVVEVNNTFGERHCYLLDSVRFGHETCADKVFHVSPFCRVEGRYRFRFMFSADRRRTVARIDYDDDRGAVLQTSVSGALEVASRAALHRALLRYPAMTLGIIARIHWQALQLLLKRVRLFTKPTAPSDFVTR
jgi:uncharacterized protein